MRYYLGPWVMRDIGGEQSYAAPQGVIGAIDLGTFPQMSRVAESRPGCLCWTNGFLPKEYTLIGDGDCREIALTSKMRSAFKSLILYKPIGDNLSDAILDCLIGGADSDGSSGPLPIVPDRKSEIALTLAGHGCVSCEKFEWGKPLHKHGDHTAKLQRLIRRDFQATFADATNGRMKDRQHHCRILDATCEKYGVDNWREFVPASIQGDIPGRLPHETTLTDNFNRADSTGLGGSWSDMQNGLCDVVSNQARGNGSSGGNCRNRYDSDLSSSDHYGQVGVAKEESAGGTPQPSGVLFRCSSSADTAYRFTCRSSSATRALSKVVAGSSTTLTSDTTSPPAVTFTPKGSASGSALKVYMNGSEIGTMATTDTSITSGVRCGISVGKATIAGDRAIVDNFECADLSGGGIIYTQLERTMRGVTRGVWTRG